MKPWRLPRVKWSLASYPSSDFTAKWGPRPGSPLWDQPRRGPLCRTPESGGRRSTHRDYDASQRPVSALRRCSASPVRGLRVGPGTRHVGARFRRRSAARALAGLPAEVLGGRRRARLRADAGCCTAELARAADAAGCDYAIAAKRNRALWREFAAIADDVWQAAEDMPGAQSPRSIAAPRGGRRTRTRSCGVRGSIRRTSPTTAAPGDGAPSPSATSPSRWAASWTTCSRSASSSPHLHRRGRRVRLRRQCRGVVPRPGRHRGPHPRGQAGCGAAAPARAPGDQPGVDVGGIVRPEPLRPAASPHRPGQEKGRAHVERLRRELLCVPARVIRAMPAAPRSGYRPANSCCPTSWPNCATYPAPPDPNNARRARPEDHAPPVGHRPEHKRAYVLQIENARSSTRTKGRLVSYPRIRV